jgi:DNA polymerase lambda
MATTDKKPVILDALRLLCKKEQQSRNTFKVKAYTKVIAALEGHVGPIKTMADVAGMPGVGDKIREKIKEILETGHLEAADALNAERPAMDASTDFQGIYGVGPAKAKELVQKRGLLSMAALREALEADASVLNDKQRIGLQYYDDLKLRIPRAEVAAIEKTVLATLKSAAPEARFLGEVVGSYRRGAQDSGDVDVLVTYPAGVSAAAALKGFKKVVQAMRDSGLLVETLAEGPKKFMGIVRLGEGGTARRLDMLLTPPAEFGFALLYFTGSDRFNVGMRAFVMTQGWSLNEHGLTRVSVEGAEVPSLPTERSIFDLFGVPYVEPMDRVAFVVPA